ncbi:MAG: penicillin-binding protein 2 [Candidatus Auribacter fodinae]|jgi:penicillin-binding protein 2|uniref:Penicillin-binding protein 2 n=1 Tax=Candidatus Auribacter fodinae TaxID=2093366 RepID=A0A3A4QZE3_9BACT|nr:MAG: penicillin-binding protein 2 [Candidatus Auribacter fodinae]
MVRNKRVEEYFSGQFEGRIKFIVFLIICVFGFLLYNFWRVQLLNGEWYSELARNNRVRKVVIPAPRGSVYDAKGIILADNRPSYDVEVVVEDIPSDKKEDIANRLSKILDMPETAILQTIKLSRRVPYVQEKVKRDVTMEQVTQIEEIRDYLPGITIRPVPVRDYRFGNHAAHILGYIGKLTAREYELLKGDGYYIQDSIGKMGIERTMEEFLKGEHGGMQVQVDSKGYTDEILGIREPNPGNNVYLTIDHYLQNHIEGLMKDNDGAAVVINPKNGDVLAMASFPDFDPNIFIRQTSKEDLKHIFSGEKNVLMNKAIRGGYPPGSTFKMLIAIAALEDGGLTVGDKYFCNGSFDFGQFIFHCWFRGGHGSVNISEALRYSCNVFFYNLGHKILGVHDIHEWSHNFGFGEKTGLLLDGEIAGINPSNEWKKQRFGEPWYPGDTINLCIGQGYMLVTPLQLAMYVAALANGGTLYRPRLVDKIVSNSGRILKTFPIEKHRQIDMSEDTWRIIYHAMEEVVQHRYGTGMKARVEGIPVAGKTGTIQLGTPENRRHHAWFVGFAPSDDPQIAVVVLMEDARSGGTDAAPIASKIIEFYLSNGQTEDSL